jgi:hypothetical protein
MQATEVIKIITGIGEVLAGKLLNYDIRTHSSIIIELSASPLAKQLHLQQKMRMKPWITNGFATLQVST